MVEEVVETRERPQDDERVAGADADQRRVFRDTLVVAAARGAVARRDAGDVRAVAGRRIRVCQAFDEERLRRRFSCGGKHVLLVEDDLDVLDRFGAEGEVRVRSVNP